MKYKLGEQSENGLYRIIAVSNFGDVTIGQIGGFVENKTNLSQEGECWIYNEATAKGNSKVKNNAKLYDFSIICDDSIIEDTSVLKGHAILEGGSVLRGNSSLNDRFRARNCILTNCTFYGEWENSNRNNTIVGAIHNGVNNRGLDSDAHFEYLGVEPSCEKILDSYHGSRSDRDFSEDALVKVGFEIERDTYIKKSECEVLQEAGWRCERDGSVRGGEYITPILDLTKAYKFIETYAFVLNGTTNSNRCGGHIHISVKGKNPTEIYNNIKHFRPILWGLYPSRAINHFSYKNNPPTSHRVDVGIRNNTVEFRIFPILRSLNQVKFRLALLRWFITHNGSTKENALEEINKNSVEFLNILHISYPTIKKKISIIKRIMSAYEIDGTKEKEIVEYLQKQCDELNK